MPATCIDSLTFSCHLDLNFELCYSDIAPISFVLIHRDILVPFTSGFVHWKFNLPTWTWTSRLSSDWVQYIVNTRDIVGAIFVTLKLCFWAPNFLCIAITNQHFFLLLLDILLIITTYFNLVYMFVLLCKYMIGQLSHKIHGLGLLIMRVPLTWRVQALSEGSRRMISGCECPLSGRFVERNFIFEIFMTILGMLWRMRSTWNENFSLTLLSI